jgi:hypothetical protein
MELIMPCTGAHPDSGKEVMAMDDADVEVDVRSVVAQITPRPKERMSKDE